MNHEIATIAADDTPEALSPSDQRVVDEAVTWLNTTVNRSGLDLAVEVRTYILDRFFEGSYESFADPSRTKPTSFQALCKREELNLSHASLYAMVRVGEQVQQLPSTVAHALTVRHHRALLSVQDATTKADLAHRAQESNWTSDQLEEAVRATAPPKSPRGRPPLPPVVKEVRALGRAIGAPPSADTLSALTTAHRDEIAKTLTTLESHIQALRAALIEPQE